METRSRIYIVFSINADILKIIILDYISNYSIQVVSQNLFYVFVQGLTFLKIQNIHNENVFLTLHLLKSARNNLMKYDI